MRPHRDSTPILLVLTCALFVLVAFLRFRDALTGRPHGRRWAEPLPLATLEAAGDALVRDTWRQLLEERDRPDTPLFALLRSPVGPAPLLMARPIEAEPPVPGVRLRGDAVQVEVLARQAFLPEDLPHSGHLRVEATYLAEGEAVERAWVEREYRLVRVGLPRPLGEHSLVLTHPSRLVDPAGENPLALVRADLAEARATLVELREARRAVEEQARLVARRLVEFAQGFQHRGQAALEPPEALAANWIDALPPHPEAPTAEPELTVPLTAGWQSVDLARWGRHAAWAEKLREAREQARGERARAWDDWRAGVARWFAPASWDTIRDEVELRGWVAVVQRDAARVLLRVGEAGARWATLEVQRVQHHLDPEEFFQPVRGPDRARLQTALARTAPEAWRQQARQVFEGEDASARCGRFLEGVGAPFAKEFEGVLFVDNAAGAPLVLAETTLPGRLVVVATGDVRLANLGPRDSAHHRVVVQAGGAVEISGRVRAFVLAKGPVALGPDAHLVGGLVLVGPGGQDRLQGSLEWDAAVRHGDPLEDMVVLVDEPDPAGRGPPRPASALAEPQAGQ